MEYPLSPEVVSNDQEDDELDAEKHHTSSQGDGKGLYRRPFASLRGTSGAVQGAIQEAREIGHVARKVVTLSPPIHDPFLRGARSSSCDANACERERSHDRKTT